MKDQEMIDQIRSGNSEKALKYLYREFPKVKQNIIANGGSKMIAQEIFNDSLLLLLEKVENQEFNLTAKLSTYLFGIARFLWLNESRKLNKRNEIEWDHTIILSSEDLGYDEEKERKLLAVERILTQISEKCKKIFKLFYYQKKKMNQIAEELDFSNVNSAKTQKYKCIEKAIKLSRTL